MSYRRRYRRRYRRPAAPAKQEPDGCLVSIIVLLLTWAAGIGVILLAIALHR